MEAMGAGNSGTKGGRVAVGATPGKTKHFQTMNLPPPDRWRGITLCDCPGLVFPKFFR